MKHKILGLLVCILLLATTGTIITPVAATTAKTQYMDIEMNALANENLQSRGDSWVMQASGFETPHVLIKYVSVVDENIVWAASNHRTLYTRTTNGGNTWMPNNVLNLPSLHFSMIFALSENTAWACINDMYEETGLQGIYATTDGGITWDRQITAEFNGNRSYPNCVHFWDANIGWCMGDSTDGYHEMYTTVDGGTTWTRVPRQNIPIPLEYEVGTEGYYDVIGDTIWFGTTVGRVYKSIDNGLHWTVAQTPLEGYLKPSFKDANHGLVLQVMGSAVLAETSDGGETWTAVDFTGTCNDADICYIPGTSNMYISTGYGASYSMDGGHSWVEYDYPDGLPMWAMDFIDGKIGWAGGRNTNQTIGGMWKYAPEHLPAFTIDITGGQGFTATIKNIGEVNATNVTAEITIEGGLFMKNFWYHENKEVLTVGQEFIIPGAPKGIGLGIIFPSPKIIVNVTCDQYVNADKTVDARIVFTKVIIK